MIKEVIQAFDASRVSLLGIFAKDGIRSYKEVLVTTLTEMNEHSKTPDGESWPMFDPKRVTRIDDGDYQGTLVFVIGETGYQPHRYYVTKVSYGSCSHCDTLQSVWDVEDVEERSRQYLTLALHMVQSMVAI